MTNQMVKGNTAVIIGAMYAGCDCFFGYPITPTVTACLIPSFLE